MTQSIELTPAWQRVDLVPGTAYSMEAEYPRPEVLLRIAADAPAADERAVRRIGAKSATVKVAAPESLWARTAGDTSGGDEGRNRLVYDDAC